MEPTKKTYQETTIQQQSPLHNDLIPVTSSSSSSSSSGLNNYYYNKTIKAPNHQKLMADLHVVHTRLHLKSPTISANPVKGSSLLDKTQHSKPPKIKSTTREELRKLKQEIKEKVENEQMEGGEWDKQELIKPPPPVVAASGVGRMTKVEVSSLNCFSQIELDEFFSRLGARILAVDMPPFMQTQAVGRARNAYNGRDKFSSRALASTLKKEFDEEFGAAWHCIVGTSFGSFVTHSVGGFLYFSLDYCSSYPRNQNHHKKLYVLMFKTSVQRSSAN